MRQPSWVPERGLAPWKPLPLITACTQLSSISRPPEPPKFRDWGGCTAHLPSPAHRAPTSQFRPPRPTMQMPQFRLPRPTMQTSQFLGRVLCFQTSTTVCPALRGLQVSMSTRNRST